MGQLALSRSLSIVGYFQFSQDLQWQKIWENSVIDDAILMLLTGNLGEAFLPCKLMTWGS